MKVDRDLIRQGSNLVAILAAFGANILANVNPINGASIGEIANTVFREVAIIPANYAFAIWGLIYLGLIGLAIYQALPANKSEPRLRKLSYFLAIASLAQIGWIFLFQYRLFALSVVAMIAILVPLALLYLRLEIALKSVSVVQKWLVNFPISLYFAWISVATIVNVASALDAAGWNGWGISKSLWTAIMLSIGAILAAILAIRRRDRVYLGVFIWAFIAIAIRQRVSLLISGTAVGLAILLLILLLMTPGQIAKE
jgi:hypothetical protein